MTSFQPSVHRPGEFSAVLHASLGENFPQWGADGVGAEVQSRCDRRIRYPESHQVGDPAFGFGELIGGHYGFAAGAWHHAVESGEAMRFGGLLDPWVKNPHVYHGSDRGHGLQVDRGHGLHI